MANVVIDKNKIDILANAIADKSGEPVTMTLDEMVSAVDGIQTGGITPTGNIDITQAGVTDVTNYATATVPTGTAGTPTATKGTVSNHSVTVTPSVTNTTGYITGSTKTGTAVTVSASELVSGSETKTANGTYDVTNLASLVVNVSGGASNFVTGTFTTGSSTSTVESVTVPYTGTGYPVMLVIVVEGGMYNPDISGWYNTIKRYAVGQITICKAVATSTPTYASSGTNNFGTVEVMYKNSTSNALDYSSTRSISYSYTSVGADGKGVTCVRWTSGTTISYRTAGGTSSSYGLLASTTYRYYAVYSG